MVASTKKSFFLILALALLVVFQSVVCVVLFRYAKDQVKELARVRFDPVGLEYYANEERKLEGKLAVFFGDSRISRWESLPEIPDHVSVNRGVHAQTTAQIMGRLERDVLALQPDLVVLQLGINDLKAIGLFPQAEDLIVDTAVENITMICERIRTAGARVYLMPVISSGPIELTRRPIWSSKIPNAISNTNQRLRDRLGEKVQWIECEAIFEEDGRPIASKYSDALHFSANAYAELNEFVRKQINSDVDHTTFRAVAE